MFTQGSIFGTCCCTESDKDTFCFRSQDGTVTMDGAVIVRQVEPIAVAQAPHAEKSLDKPDVLFPGVRSITREEKELEKARLQTLVNNFVKDASHGIPCTYLKEVTGERAVTRYVLDKRLENLIIVAACDPTVAEVRCPIAAIQDVYCCAEDGAGCFPAKVVAPLSAEEQQLLLMIVYRSERKRTNSDTHRFCLLADSASGRDTFLECLRILCIYTQTLAKSKQVGSVQGPTQPESETSWMRLVRANTPH